MGDESLKNGRAEEAMKELMQACREMTNPLSYKHQDECRKRIGEALEKLDNAKALTETP
jgi:hypothetical protein